MTITNQQLQDIAKSYVDLLIVQYNDKPKARATIQLLASEVLANGVINQVRDGVNIDTAQGKQLDILGKYIGLTRLILAIETSVITFGLIPYGTELWKDKGYGGFAVYGEDPTTDNVGTLISYEDSRNGTKIDDNSYRLLLKLKILQNISNFSTGQLQTQLHTFFPPNGNTGGKDMIEMTDNQDMTITFTLNDKTEGSLFNIALDKGLLPTPMGVRAILII